MTTNSSLTTTESAVDELVLRLETWYRETVRPFLEQYRGDKLAGLDSDFDRLRKTVARSREELAICFLGASGVGKSTLINALVADRETLVPSGGSGPLTALAMQVRYGEDRAFEVEYQPPSRLWRLTFGLEQSFKRRQKVAPLTDDFGSVGDEDDDPVADLVDAMEGDDREDSTYANLCKQAQQIVRGSPDNADSVPYLLDRLRELSGHRPVWGTEAKHEDRSRLERLQLALVAGKGHQRVRFSDSGQGDTFRRELTDHATGFLAPIIRQIDVFWNSPILELGITLVDLPGLGVAGDIYKEITRTWINEKARAVVLVVDNRGVKDSDADILRRSDFLTRLLFSVDDPGEDPAVLLVSVTQLDSAAEGRYLQDKTKRKREHLAEAFEASVALVERQLREQLETTTLSSETPLRGGQQRVVDYVLRHLRIFPVSAYEHTRLLSADEDDPAFISAPSNSGIPQMRDGLKDVAQFWRRRVREHTSEATKAFVDRVLTTVQLVEATWRQEGRATLEAESLRRELEVIIAPMRDEFQVRKGAFRAFLRSEVPNRISSLVSEAGQQAYKDIRKHLRSLDDAHWSTLRATVTHDGRFKGARDIDLPDQFSQRFVEPIAEVWGERLLQEIRKQTRHFTNDAVAQLESLVEWCRGQGAKVQPRLLESLVESIKADTKQVNLVGKEAISDLRTDVKNRLKSAIEKPIRRQCQNFVKRNDHIGRGVKRRILELFDELADAITSDATSVASQILTQGFTQVERELRDVTKSLEHPFDAAMNALVESHENRLQRMDSKTKALVIEASRNVTDSCPLR